MVTGRIDGAAPPSEGSRDPPQSNFLTLGEILRGKREAFCAEHDMTNAAFCAEREAAAME